MGKERIHIRLKHRCRKRAADRAPLPQFIMQRRSKKKRDGEGKRARGKESMPVNTGQE